ncbi:MAG: hypothetical protein MZW92_30395 [Comamonadaceae bacterium]|nr:hypothetical protein [Comamonadaceae bacterium]
MYFDTAVAGYWRALALPYHETHGAARAATCTCARPRVEYDGSARYDDQLEVGIRCARIGNSSMVFEARGVPRRRQLLVHGELVYVFADPATQTSRPVPQPLRDVLQGFEAGRADGRRARRQLGRRWAAMRSAIRTRGVRRRAAHSGRAGMGRRRRQRACTRWPCNRLGMAAGHRPAAASTRRAWPRIGRMAVLPALRGSGVGRAVLDALMRGGARRAATPRSLLHAQASAAPLLSPRRLRAARRALRGGRHRRTMEMVPRQACRRGRLGAHRRRRSRDRRAARGDARSGLDRLEAPPRWRGPSSACGPATRASVDRDRRQLGVDGPGGRGVDLHPASRGSPSARSQQPRARQRRRRSPRVTAAARSSHRGERRRRVLPRRLRRASRRRARDRGAALAQAASAGNGVGQRHGVSTGPSARPRAAGRPRSAAIFSSDQRRVASRPSDAGAAPPCPAGCAGSALWKTSCPGCSGRARCRPGTRGA